ncbi:hypothetical protein D9M69_722790 [compost metagenome]
MSHVAKNPACEFSAAFRAKLQQLVDDTPGFEDPDFQVSGADLVDWFGEFRAEVKELLAQSGEGK